MLANPRYALLRPSFAHGREITRFGGLLSLTSLIGAANAEGVRFILGGFAGPANLAQFGWAEQVPNVSRQGLFRPIARILSPAWLRARKSFVYGTNVSVREALRGP